MWAQQWNNIYDLVEPYKGREEIDVTPQMIKQVVLHLYSVYIVAVNEYIHK